MATKKTPKPATPTTRRPRIAPPAAPAAAPPLDAATLAAIEAAATEQVSAAVTRGGLRGAVEALQDLVAGLSADPAANDVEPRARGIHAAVLAMTLQPGPTPPPRVPGQRRTAEQMEALEASVLATIVARPGTKAKDLARALNLEASDIREGIHNLRDRGAIDSTGRKQGTKYYAVGAPAAAPSVAA